MFKDENRHYSLRKLSVGLASVLIGISFASSMNGNSVKADTVSAQTSAIETKTSKNNKVDANADASKEVVNTANSVDANKLNPDKTVLNKQATSNDLLEGTDVKQGTQETSAKPASTQAQPAVPRQALETSLSKDTTKPETTNTLNITKTSRIPVNTKTVAEDKTQVTQNQDWADPAKQGYYKTTAGWVRNSDNYVKSPYVAKKIQHTNYE